MLGHALLVGAWAYYVVAAICVVLGLQMMGVDQPARSTRSTASCRTGARSAAGSWVRSCSASCSASWPRPARPRFSRPSRRSRPRGARCARRAAALRVRAGEGRPADAARAWPRARSPSCARCRARPACSRRSAAWRSSARQPTSSGSPETSRRCDGRDNDQSRQPGSLRLRRSTGVLGRSARGTGLLGGFDLSHARRMAPPRVGGTAQA